MQAAKAKAAAARPVPVLSVTRRAAPRVTPYTPPPPLASQAPSSYSPSPDPTPTPAPTLTVQASGDPQQYALAQVGAAQFACLLPLWNRESGWQWNAENPSSGAYGIPQAEPGYKMASAGTDWQTNPITQVKWGLQYISQTYGTPCGAWQHELADGWY